MNEIQLLELLSIAGLGLTALVNWKTGLAENLTNKFVSSSSDGINWLLSPDGTYASLPEQLPFWDFYEDFILTKNGWLWSVAEIKAISIGGFDGDDWQLLSDRLNRVYTALPENTWIQVVSGIDNDLSRAIKVYEKLAKRTKHSPLYPLIISRLKQLKEQSRYGVLRDSKTYVLIGRKRPESITKVPLTAIFSSNAFQEIESEDFQELQEEVLRTRESFLYNYQNCGGECRPVKANVAFKEAFERLNPGRSKFLAAPDYQAVNKKKSNLVSKAVTFSDLNAELFADNPRESLCFTPAEVVDWFIKFEDVYVGNISLYKLPTRVFVGLLSWFTQAPEINFKISISTSFRVANFRDVDEKLESLLSWRRRNIRVAQDDANQDEQIQALEIAAVREQIRKGEEKIGDLGLQISFEASSKSELKHHRDLILSLLVRLEGMQGCAEPHDPFSLYLASLPCGVEQDFRQKLCLSRDAIALSPFTGCGSGVPINEATYVFNTVEGRPYYWDPYPSTFNSGMTLVVGPTGSGKSSLLNILRSVNHFSGRRIVILDFGGSATRVCLGLKGNYIDITDPAKCRGLGLFNIRPMPDEEYEAHELTEEGLPLDKLAALEKMVEILCLNPGELALPKVMVGVLKRYLRETYANLMDEVPTVDDLITTLENAHPEDREICKELIARLSDCASNSSLGNFLNDQGNPLPVDNDCTVFDFRGAIDDPRLMLIAAMAVTNFFNRFLRVNSKQRKVKKAIDIDEFKVISRYLPILQVIEILWRTARKSEAICTVSSQSAGDFDTNDLTKGIKENCEVFFVLPGSDPSYVATKLGLSEGEKEDLQGLQVAGKDYRECLVLHPAPGIRRACAKLRLDLSVLDRRLMLGAGREKATLKEALENVPREHMQESFYQALVADPLGADVGKNKIRETQLVL